MLHVLIPAAWTPTDNRTMRVWIGSRDVTSKVKWDTFHTQDGSLNVRGRTTMRLEVSPIDYPEIRVHAPLVVYDYPRDRNIVRAYVTSVKAERVPGYTHLVVTAEDATSILDDSMVVYETRRQVESFRARLGRFVGGYLHASSHVSADLSLVEELSSSLPVQPYVGMTLSEVIETLISQSDHPNATYYIDGAGRLRVHDLSGASAPYNISDVASAAVDTGARTEVTRGGPHEAFPSLARASNGDLVLVYRSAADHSAGGPLLVRLSPDNGDSWGPAIQVEDVVGGPNVVRTSAGTLVLAYRWSDTALYVRRSTDNGRTWGSRFLATAGGTDGGGHPTASIVQAPNGDLLLPYYAKDTTETFTSAEYVRSTDDGVTWGARTNIRDGQADGRDYQEPCIALSGSTLICLTRSPDNIFRRMTSTDNGVTWSAPAGVLDPATGRPAMTVETSGAIFLNYRHVPTFAGDHQRAVWRRSTDDGLTWSAETLLDSADGGWRTVYGWAVQVPSGPLVIAYGIEGDGGVAATEADIYVRRFVGVVVPKRIGVNRDVQTYGNSVWVRGAAPDSTLNVNDHAAIEAAGRLVRTRDLSAPDSTTAAMSRTLGSMYLGRVAGTKERGHFEVLSPNDGWRGGQFVHVTDAELNIDGSYRIIGVDTSVVKPGSSPTFRYAVSFGGARGGD